MRFELIITGTRPDTRWTEVRDAANAGDVVETVFRVLSSGWLAIGSADAGGFIIPAASIHDIELRPWLPPSPT